MRTLMALSLLSCPAVLQAMYGPGGPGPDCPDIGGLVAGAAYGLVAVLGYWVLLQAVKQAEAWVKRVGYALGCVLALVGALGLLCAVFSHSRCSSRRACFGPGMMPPPMGMGMNPGMNPGMLPPGHPPFGGEDMPEPGAKKGARSR